MTLKNSIYGLALSAGLLLPSLSVAQDAFTGPYAGVKAGIGILNSNGRSNKGPFQLSEDGGAFGAILGARTEVTDQIILGLELDGTYQTLNKGWRYGASGLIGIPVNDDGLTFVRFGYTKMDDDLIDLDGLTLGIGYEHVISENINFRADIQHFPYKDLTIDDVTTNYKGYEISAGVIFNF